MFWAVMFVGSIALMVEFIAKTSHLVAGLRDQRVGFFGQLFIALLGFFGKTSNAVHELREQRARVAGILFIVAGVILACHTVTTNAGVAQPWQWVSVTALFTLGMLLS